MVMVKCQSRQVTGMKVMGCGQCGNDNGYDPGGWN